MRPSLPRLAPILFVLLWSTGFIGSKYGMRNAEPFTFLALRLAIAAALLRGLATLVKSKQSLTRIQYLHAAVVGLLLHGTYLGGVYYALRLGMPAGMVAVIAGLQPLLSAIVARYMLQEQGSILQWVGLVMGFVGVVTVVSEKVHTNLPVASYVAAVIGLLGTTAGTLYQKRFGKDIPLIRGTAVQYLAVSAVLIPLALAFETLEIRWTEEFIFALIWLVVVLSLGAICLLLYLIARTGIAQVTSLFYLVPPMTALEAFVLFDEKLSALAVCGMVVAAIGVFLVVRSAPASPVHHAERSRNP
jgi:drug/metabolite transporter (DMT)-like permease